LRDENVAGIFDDASLYCRRLGVNDPIAEVFIAFVHMLHLPDLTAEDVKLRDDLDVWVFM
jgi:hypothetical protein